MQKSIGVLVCLLFCSTAFSAEPSVVVTKFYEKYFVSLSKKSKAPKFKFTNSFSGLIAENEKLCKKQPPDEICGFGADADVYLDAQDFEENLTFKKAKAKVSKVSAELVSISFNLFPSEKNFKETRTIQYKFIKQGNDWLVDDIIYVDHSQSARKLLEEENKIMSKK